MSDSKIALTYRKFASGAVGTDDRNFQEINYDSPRGGVSVITEKGDITVSYLLVQRARDSDSGKYTCNPSNANPKTVTVHVLNGKWPVISLVKI